MKNVTITYDDEKLSALRLYLGQKESNVEDELTVALEALYQKTVPSNVRGFLDMRAGLPKAETVRKMKKSASSAVEDVPEPGGEGT